MDRDMNVTKKSIVDNVKEMEPKKRMFFVGAALTPPLFTFFSYLAVSWGSIFVLGLAIMLGLVSLIGLLALEISDETRSHIPKNSDKFRIPFYFSSGVAILGIFAFTPIYYVGSIAVVAITILRERNEGDRDSANSGEAVNKSSGLL